MNIVVENFTQKIADVNIVVRCVNDNYIQKRKERKQLEKNRVCVICNKPFVAKKKDAIYCSNACKQKAYRLKKKGCY